MTEEQSKAVDNLIKAGMRADKACLLTGVSFEEYNAKKLKIMLPDELLNIFGDFNKKEK